MDFGFSKEQEMIRKSAKDFCDKECSRDFLFEMWDDALGYSKKSWKKMAELGWLGLLFEEKYGGQELTFVDLCVVLEEMGKVLFPSPYISTTILYGHSILYGGSQEQKEKILPDISKGKITGTLAVLEESGGLDAGDINMKATPDGNGYILNGVKLFVPDLFPDGSMVVAVRTSQNDDPAHGITLFIVDAGTEGVDITQFKTMDMLRRLSEVRFHEVKVHKDNVLGDVDYGWQILALVKYAACAALSVEMVGGAQKCLDDSVDYAKKREQFGKPIGSFQAIKHKCADMLLLLETARSAAYYASWSIAEQSTEMKLATSVAKSWCSEAFKQITIDAIQVHGGVGFTWEFLLHMFFKRAQANEAMFGNADYHREEVMKVIEGARMFS